MIRTSFVIPAQDHQYYALAYFTIHVRLRTISVPTAIKRKILGLQLFVNPQTTFS